MNATTKTALGLSLAISSFATSAPIVGEQRFLNRSIYVPVAFSLCEHLDDAMLYEAGQAVTLLPATRIFQFTYYPELERTEPQAVQIRIEETDTAKEQPFKARLAVTAGGIYTAHREIPLDRAKYKEKFRYQIDVRHKKVDLVLHCKRLCSRERETEPTEASSDHP